MKKTLLAGMLALAFSPLAFSQEAVSVGPRTSYLPNVGEYTGGLSLQYKTRDGMHFPVSIEIGEGIQKATAGMGFKHNLGSLMTHSVGAALGNINFDAESDLADGERINRVAFLLQNELNFQLSRSISLGVHVDMDVFNWINVSDVRADYDYNLLSEFGGDKDLRDAALNKDIQLQRNKSMSSFGLSLKIDILESKNGRSY